MSIQCIDLNSDLGESYGPWSMGDDSAMLSIVTSANIACGGHASDPNTMFQTLTQARKKNVVIGAHPGFNDREGFGRRLIPMEPAEIGRLCAAQIGSLMALSALAGTKVAYVKPHGALGNLAARDRAVADVITATVQSIDPSLAMLAISGTQSELSAKAAGVPVYSEIFADRGYLGNGQLVPREQSGAIIHDAKEATDRLLDYLRTGLMPVVDGDPIAIDAHSICVHGDSEHAVAMAHEIRSRLTAVGLQVKSFL